MKINIPQAVIIGAVIIALAILFRADYPVLATEAKAEVGGKDYPALVKDNDVRRAAGSVIERCRFRGRLEDGRFYSTGISC